MEERATVRLEDMREIAAFARLNHRRKEAISEIAELDKRVNNWEDAEEAVMMADESVPGNIKQQVGECFFDTDGASALQLVTQSLLADRAARDRLTALLATTVAEMDALKKKLYARFGSSISLEDG